MQSTCGVAFPAFTSVPSNSLTGALPENRAGRSGSLGSSGSSASGSGAGSGGGAGGTRRQRGDTDDDMMGRPGTASGTADGST